MKKIITLCLFALAMIVGTQSATAQSIVEVNATAAKKTKELKQFIKFDNDTEDVVYQTYQNYVRKVYAMNEAMVAGSAVKENDKIELNNYVDKKLKAVFTDDQYKRYLEYLKIPK